MNFIKNYKLEVNKLMQSIIHEKLKKIIKILNTNLIERNNVVKLGLLALVSNSNFLIIGPPGTAKSEIARRISKITSNCTYFEYLLTKFTTPDELFGPLSITGLKNDEFKRNVDGFMPTSNIVFLDEIFKASSSILNSLLTIINEKIYHNGKQKIEVPLLLLIGASNELPTNESELYALYDRFLIKVVVNYINNNSLIDLLQINPDFSLKNISDDEKLTYEELKEIIIKSENITIPEEIFEVIKKIVVEYKDTFSDEISEKVSDRKLVNIMKLLKISAYTNNRSEVDFSDVLLIYNFLWNNVKNIALTKCLK